MRENKDTQTKDKPNITNMKKQTLHSYKKQDMFYKTKQLQHNRYNKNNKQKLITLNTN